MEAEFITEDTQLNFGDSVTVRYGHFFEENVQENHEIMGEVFQRFNKEDWVIFFHGNEVLPKLVPFKCSVVSFKTRPAENDKWKNSLLVRVNAEKRKLLNIEAKPADVDAAVDAAVVAAAAVAAAEAPAAAAVAAPQGNGGRGARNPPRIRRDPQALRDANQARLDQNNADVRNERLNKDEKTRNLMLSIFGRATYDMIQNRSNNNVNLPTNTNIYRKHINTLLRYQEKAKVLQIALYKKLSKFNTWDMINCEQEATFHQFRETRALLLQVNPNPARRHKRAGKHVSIRGGYSNA